VTSSSGRAGTALAMHGAGFRSLAACTGLVAGLLAALGDERLEHSALLGRFDGISTGGGSSLFFASLAFSQRFVGLVQELAADPSSVGKKFKKDWVAPWVARGVKANPFAKIFARISRHVNPTLTEDILLWSYFWKDGYTWQRCVETFLQTTAGIDASLMMGSEPCEWAKHKIWIAGSSMLAPTSKEKGVLLWRHEKNDTDKVVYYVEGPDFDRRVPTHLPARLSVVLGAGPDASAALPVISRRGLQDESTLVFVGCQKGKQSGAQKLSQRSEAIHGFMQSDSIIASCPVAGVVAASAAAAGGAAMEPLASDLLLPADMSLCPLFCNADGSEAFSGVTKLLQGLQDMEDVRKESLEHLARLQVRGLVDAGYSDSTGICHAVSAGAKEVTAILHSDCLASCPGALLKLFPGYTGSEPADKLLFPVFAYPSADQVDADFVDFEVIEPRLKSAHLLGIRVGSIYLARTLDNPWFDIMQDRIVKLNIVCIASKVSVRQLKDFDSFGDLVQDIVQALVNTDRPDIVQSSLLPMFVGSAC